MGAPDEIVYYGDWTYTLVERSQGYLILMGGPDLGDPNWSVWNWNLHAGPGVGPLVAFGWSPSREGAFAAAMATADHCPPDPERHDYDGAN